MGKGIIDYLGRYYLGDRITSDGRVVVALSWDGVVPGRAAMTVFTGHRTHRWYPVLVVCDENGSEAPQLYDVKCSARGLLPIEWTPC